MRAPTARPPRRPNSHPCPAWYALLASAAWPAASALAEPSAAAARWAALEGELAGEATAAPARPLELPPLGAFAPGDPQQEEARFRADPLRPLTVSAALGRWCGAVDVAAAGAAVADLERLCRGESALACEVLVALEVAVPAPRSEREPAPCGVAGARAKPGRPGAALAAVQAQLTPAARAELSAEGLPAMCGPVGREGALGGARRRAHPARRSPHRLEHRRGPGPRATRQRPRAAGVSPNASLTEGGKSR